MRFLLKFSAISNNTDAALALSDKQLMPYLSIDQKGTKIS
jgi:hypothetical protein